MKTTLLLPLCALWLAAAPAAAQAPVVPGQGSGAAALGAASVGQAPTASPEQLELTKITAENMISDQKTKKKLQQLNDEKEGLRVQYDLFVQKQKLKNSELEVELDRLTNTNKLSAQKHQQDLDATQAAVDKLATENALAKEQHRRDLDALQTALDKAATENALAKEKLKTDVAALDAEYEKLAAQDRLNDERLKAETSKSSAELQKLALENSLAGERNKQGLLALAQRLDKSKLENDLKAEEERAATLSDEKEKRGIDLALKRMELEERRIKFEALSMDSRMAKLKSDLELRDKRWEWKKEANTEPVYTTEPFRDGRLIVSDRRVPLNGPIFTGVATYVTDRIHYFNNISSAPIFIVIDRCPGGSVMEGYRIIKAMQASQAPIYVVVKSFAASMAAVITTMADRSYVYPNAIILHHQMSTMNWGNMTQLKEQLELAREWEKRLHAPVAKKMGVSLEEFRKKMYEKNSDGDWEEFGDKAVGYHWAGGVVHEIDETGFLKNPDFDVKPAKPAFWLDEKTDEKGSRYVSLPRLDPFDFYFIYNPDRYYR
ncbi:MAG: ATP-dependent Clp protease proteolytic subunit [Elusimicrobia bacterium]|nr:ATP-dependent Clp protease proteolytic subunit [Elusimicrobiota bacterium]